MTEDNADENQYQSCLFLKHRDIIKFEKFYSNHPAIYLPFVCYNFFLMSLLPSMAPYRGGDESLMAVEKSRIKLLQELKLTLKIIQVLINTTLDSEIVLDEIRFEENVRKLQLAQKESTMNKELVEPLLYPEHYMSEADAIVYKKKLSSLLPVANLVSKSADLIPCQKFYLEMEKSNQLMGTSIWGPAFWTVTHYACYIIDNYKSDDYESKQYMAALSGIFDLLLPCSYCSGHYRGLENTYQVPDTLSEDLKTLQRPFPLTLPFMALEYAKKNRLFEFYSSLHFHCKPNSINSKESLGVEYFENIYRAFWNNTPHSNTQQ